LILTHTNDISFYKEHIKNNEDINAIYHNVDCEHNNYLVKVNYAIQYAETNNIQYMMKCDNDLFLKAQTLDYMIENLHLLEDRKNLTLGPVLTSGIPCVEYFKEQFLDSNSTEILNQLFLQTQIYDMFGANYSALNEYTLNAQSWNKDNFFNGVKNLNHHYKGIHPIRVNEESLNFLNNYIIQEKERFLSDQELSIINDDKSPYLCNSIFCIKTDIYKEVVNDTSLYVDCFEEVPLNKYCWKNECSHLFVKNGFAIHMYYNWKNNHLEYEKDFCEKFFTKHQ
jgi:hypothetical protein